MMEAIKKDNIIAYAEGIITPSRIDTAEIIEQISDENGSTTIWLLESDMQEEYYVLEGDYPSNIFKRSGIYKDIKNVYAAYIELNKEDYQKQEQLDRFNYM